MSSYVTRLARVCVEEDDDGIHKAIAKVEKCRKVSIFIALTSGQKEATVLPPTSLITYPYILFLPQPHLNAHSHCPAHLPHSTVLVPFLTFSPIPPPFL